MIMLRYRRQKWVRAVKADLDLVSDGSDGRVEIAFIKCG